MSPRAVAPTVLRPRSAAPPHRDTVAAAAPLGAARRWETSRTRGGSYGVTCAWDAALASRRSARLRRRRGAIERTPAVSERRLAGRLRAASASERAPIVATFDPPAPPSRGGWGRA